MPTIKLTPAEAAALERRPGVVVRRMTNDTPAVRNKRPAALLAPSLCVDAVIALQTRSELNLREHWTVKRRRQEEARRAWYETIQFPGWLYKPPLDISFTRLGGNKLDPDAVSSCFKHIQDVVCAWLNVDDGDERLAFHYDQNPGGAYGVRVQIHKAF